VVPHCSDEPHDLAGPAIQDQALADRIGRGEMLPREGLIDDDDGRSRRSVMGRELPAAEEGDAHGAEVSRCGDPEVGLWPFARARRGLALHDDGEVEVDADRIEGQRAYRGRRLHTGQRAQPVHQVGEEGRLA
jgi:hypothetical protein